MDTAKWERRWPVLMKTSCYRSGVFFSRCIKLVGRFKKKKSTYGCERQFGYGYVTKLNLHVKYVGLIETL